MVKAAANPTLQSVPTKVQIAAINATEFKLNGVDITSAADPYDFIDTEKLAAHISEKTNNQPVHSIEI